MNEPDSGDVLRRAYERLEVIGRQMAELAAASMATVDPSFDFREFMREHEGEEMETILAEVRERYPNDEGISEEARARFAALQESMRHVVYIITGLDVDGAPLPDQSFSP